MFTSRFRASARLIVLLALALFASLSAFAQDVPFKYQVEWDGLNGTGLTTFVGRKFDFDINTTFSTTGGGGGVGKVVPSPVKVLRQWDESSPLLFAAATSGRHYSKVTVSFGQFKKRGDTFLPAVQYIFEDVIVTGFHSIAADQDVATLRFQQNFGTTFETNQLEEVTFQYSKVTIRHLDSGNEATYRVN